MRSVVQRLGRVRWLVAALVLGGCGSEEPVCGEACADAGLSDAGIPTDSGVDLGVAPDTGLEDTGVSPPDLGSEDAGRPIMACGTGAGQCAEPLDCGGERAAPTNCPFCPPDHADLCLGGSCSAPPRLQVTDVQEVGFVIDGAFSIQLESLVGVVIAQETPSGAMLDCEEVTDRAFDIGGACYNVLTSRTIAISQVGQSYSFQFGTFPGDLPVLLLVYGFDANRPEGSPLGVSCTPYQVGAPGSGPAMIPGGDMVAW